MSTTALISDAEMQVNAAGFKSTLWIPEFGWSASEAEAAEKAKECELQLIGLEREAAALRKKLAAMKELVAMRNPIASTESSPDVANWLKRASGTYGVKRKWCILKAKEAQEALRTK